MAIVLVSDLIMVFSESFIFSTFSLGSWELILRVWIITLFEPMRWYFSVPKLFNTLISNIRAQIKEPSSSGCDLVNRQKMQTSIK